jgi:RHS repeat-associated protein
LSRRKTKSRASRAHEFNSFDQLAQGIECTETWGAWTSTMFGEYWYDANGMRARALESGVDTRYVDLGHDPVYEVSGSVKTDYVHVNGKLKAKLTGSETFYYSADALGSTRLVWKDETSKAATSPTFRVPTYRPFGTPVAVLGTEKVMYAGKLTDTAAGYTPGLYYIGTRWMNPELRRWLSMDPQLGKLSMPQTMNRYVYCVNNPLRFTDPTGKVIPLILAAIGSTIASGAIIGGTAGAIYYVYEWWSAGDEPFSLPALEKRSIEGAVFGGLTVAIEIFAKPIATTLGAPVPAGIPGQAVKAIDPWLNKLLGLHPEWPKGLRDRMQKGQEGPTANEVKDWFKHLKLPRIGGGPPMPDFGFALNPLRSFTGGALGSGLISGIQASAGVAKAQPSNAVVVSLPSFTLSLPVLRLGF